MCRGSSTHSQYHAEERALTATIGQLESELHSTHSQARQLQGLLRNSNSHYDELERKYSRAKQMLKDYEDRSVARCRHHCPTFDSACSERNLLEREEAHLRQLRDKDAQYMQLINQMNVKIGQLERQLRDAHQVASSSLPLRSLG